jgi:hypothetical protein
VGVRNFPDKGIKGESFLRECYEKSIADLGGCFLPQDDVCVDFGCGTGEVPECFYQNKIISSVLAIISGDLVSYLYHIFIPRHDQDFLLKVTQVEVYTIENDFSIHVYRERETDVESQTDREREGDRQTERERERESC